MPIGFVSINLNLVFRKKKSFVSVKPKSSEIQKKKAGSFEDIFLCNYFLLFRRLFEIVFSFQFYDENIEAFHLIEKCPDKDPSSTSQVQKEKEYLNKGKLLLSEYSLFIVREKFCVMSKGNTLMKCGMLNWKFLSN